jgi:hypothetical protein
VSTSSASYLLFPRNVLCAAHAITY